MSSRRARKKQYKKYRVSSKNIKIAKFKTDDKKSVMTKKFQRQNIFIWSLIIILSVFAFLFFNYVLMPHIYLKGGSYIEINYKEKYKEPGFKASYQGEDITNNVKSLGDVNSKRLGLYKIVYEVNYGNISKKVIRRVRVVDKSKPVIEVENKGDFYICPGDKYRSVKYKAFDNYDLDITDKVKVKVRNNYVLYEVSDSSHNKSVLRKKIIYEDIEKPSIDLDGGDTIYIFIGDEYKDSYKAFDNCDGNISSKVKVEGKVDTRNSGEYRVKYTVEDNSGNKTSKSRKVIVSERNKKGSIYLTFDDGPRAGTTDVILDILKEEGIKATFFVTNSGDDSLIKREYEEGHTVGLHTASHDYGYVYSSVDNYFNDLYSVFDRVKRITGNSSMIIRFPGGSSNTISRRYSQGIMTELTSEVLRRGFRYYDWNLSSGDAEAGIHTKEEIVSNVTSNLSLDRVNVVLMHDIKPYTRDALRDIIRYGKENGYVFSNITMETEMFRQRVNN